MELTATQTTFVLHWGEMANRWGINRTVAQVHGLLMVAAKPLPADEIANALNVARSNVSTSIRELEAWGLIRSMHTLGDRRTHYEALDDVWEMFRAIVEQRKKREIDPTLQMLRSCLQESTGPSAEDAQVKHRLAELLEFFSAIDAIYSDVRRLPNAALRRLLKARGALRKLGLGERA